MEIITRKEYFVNMKERITTFTPNFFLKQFLFFSK